MHLLVKDASNTKEIIINTNIDAVNLSNQAVSFSDEALLYLIHLSGHPKIMFMYRVFYLLN
jgi:hypothetical protein